MLRNYAEKLEADKPALAELISRDMGKPLWESLGEVNSMVGKVEISVKATSRPMWDAGNIRWGMLAA